MINFLEKTVMKTIAIVIDYFINKAMIIFLDSVINKVMDNRFI